MTATAEPGWYQTEMDFDGIERYWDGTQWTVETRPAGQPSAPPGDGQGFLPDRCDICERSPARLVKYSGVTGLLLARSNWWFESQLCVACSSGLFRRVQSKLLITGWWSITSFLTTPFLLFANAAKMLHHRRTIGAAHIADPERDRELSGRPLVLRAGPLLIIAFIVIASVNTFVLGDSDDDGPPPVEAAATAATTVPTVARNSLPIGACFDMPDLVSIPEDVTPVSCEQSHGYELYGRNVLDPGPFPGSESIDESAVDFCVALFASYVGVDYDDSVFEVEYLFPTRLGWADGDRMIECLIAGNGPDIAGDLIGSARAAGY